MIGDKTKNGLIKYPFDKVNDLWFAVEPEFYSDAIKWMLMTEKKDNSFHAKWNTKEGLYEVYKNT